MHKRNILKNPFTSAQKNQRRPKIALIAFSAVALLSFITSSGFIPFVNTDQASAAPPKAYGIDKNTIEYKGENYKLVGPTGVGFLEFAIDGSRISESKKGVCDGSGSPIIRVKASYETTLASESPDTLLACSNSTSTTVITVSKKSSGGSGGSGSSSSRPTLEGTLVSQDTLEVDGQRFTYSESQGSTFRMNEANRIKHCDSPGAATIDISGGGGIKESDFEDGPVRGTVYCSGTHVANLSVKAGAEFSDDEEEEEETCIVDSGWAICPIFEFLANSTDSIYEGVVEMFIRVPPISTDVNSGSFKAWQQFRNLANIAFIIAFLIVIYSQITGMGIDNYGIKKILPRIIVAAILVNVSYWVAAVAVDLSNVIGSSINDLLANIGDRIEFDDVPFWADMVTAVLSGGAIVAGGITIATLGTSAIFAALSFIAPLLISALVAVLVAIVTLALRQALIVIFVIISPLAFVAMLLPNTEKMFTKWRQWFTSLLLLYPAVAILFGGARLAGKVISQGNATGVAQLALYGTALFASVAPLFLIPFMIRKYGGNGIDKLAGNIQSRGAKMAEKANAPLRRAGHNNLRRGYNKYSTDTKPGARSARRFNQWRQGFGRQDDYYKNLQDEQLQDRVAHDEKYREKITGGDKTQAKVEQARAASALTRINDEKVEAARKNFELTGDSNRDVLMDKYLKNPDQYDQFQKQAIRQMAVNTGNIKFIQPLWDESASWSQGERNNFGEALFKNRPSGVSGGAVGRMINAKGGTLDSVLLGGAVDGNYDAKGLASGDDTEVKYLAERLATTSGQEALKTIAKKKGANPDTVLADLHKSAHEAATNPRFGAGKNIPFLKQFNQNVPERL